ncbi:MAG: deoxyribodipyrimidine photolyase-related protein [Planctomycetota bacterium]|jgi:deoxyribodipyrimidine photolyase-related protein
MTVLRLILGDQLSSSISSLEGCDTSNDIILMCEVWDEAIYVKHHKKKIAFLFSAMRHFAEELRESGYKVEYTRLDNENNAGSFKGEVERALKRHDIDRIFVTYPGEYRVLANIQTWENDFGIPVEIRPDDRFLCTPDAFADWAKDRKQLRMEYFYREMRKKYSILMDGEEPVGGKWNYDAENRQPPKEGLTIPKPYINKTDNVSGEVIELVADHFGEHFGDLEPFYFAVTRDQALQVLQLFIEQRLKHFGDYQDAMIEDEPWMYHSHISFYLNCGLLLPLECVEAAEEAYHQGNAPLNAVEGFIRQIIGWREYIRGIYWLKMPGYAEKNFFEAKRSLPEFYWTADTKMNCLRQCVSETKENAYAHHIQRLMVLGNFGLLAEVDPRQVNEWFLIVYADAYEWVELPNVSGMILFADGGFLASKPYAAGGGYINKMSNYCKHCSYKVTKKNGPDACPFNYLYWDFLARNRKKLSSNHRIGMMYKTYDRMDEDKKQAIRNDSQHFLGGLQ